jgi:hypothetical protein
MGYDFNGTNGFIVNTTAAPLTTLPCTIACWFGGTNAEGHLVNICNNLRLALLPTGILRINSVDNGTPTQAETITATNGNGSWEHACGVFASTTSRTVYLNGFGAGTNTTSSAPTGFTRFQIGARRNSNTTDTFFGLGRIADVGVWDAALTDTEIQSLAKGVACPFVRPQNLVFYAPLVRDLLDISKTNLPLTISGGVTVSTVGVPHPRIYL